VTFDGIKIAGVIFSLPVEENPALHSDAFRCVAGCASLAKEKLDRGRKQVAKGGFAAMNPESTGRDEGIVSSLRKTGESHESLNADRQSLHP
jgi:hypothetical protein